MVPMPARTTTASTRLLERRRRRLARFSDAMPFDNVLTAARVGGSWALEELYRRHDPALRRYLRARVGSDAEDLASQTWIDAARGLGRFEGGEDDFRAWMFTIARRRLVDDARRRARRPEQPVDDQILLDRAVDDADPAGAIAGAVDGEDAARRIAEILPPGQAEIVLLRVVGGLDTDEVAKVTGKRAGTIRVIQHRALRRLARHFEV